MIGSTHASEAEEAKLELLARHGSRKKTQPLVNLGEPVDVLGISSSYFSLRFGLITAAFLLPIVLIGTGWIADGTVQHSLSAYYHASLSDPIDPGSGGLKRNVFVGTLWAVGAFLFLYRGYSIKENLALNTAGVSAIMISVFPMDWPEKPGDLSWIATIHAGSAIVFFVLIAYVCVFRAHDTVSILNNQRDQKVFYRAYRTIGTIMVLAPLTIVLIHLAFDWLQNSYLVLLVEIAGVWAFSAFWWTKSREILKIERE